MPDGKQADVENDVLQSIEKENDAHQEREMIVAGHHMLGAEVDEGSNRSALIRLNKGGVSLGYIVRAGRAREQQPGDDHRHKQSCACQHSCTKVYHDELLKPETQKLPGR